MYLLTIILFSFTFTSCAEESTVNLDVWVGEYGFFESTLNPVNDTIMMWDYYIDIYKEGNGYFANIVVQGRMTDKDIITRVVGDENAISLLFEENTISEWQPRYEKGDVILTLENSEYGMLTYWGKLSPNLYESQVQGMVHFTGIERSR